MRNWVAQQVTTTGTTSVGTVLNLGSAVADHLAFAARYANGATLEHLVVTDDTGAGVNRMVIDATLATGTPDTLTIDRVHEKLDGGVLSEAPASGLTLSGAGTNGIRVDVEAEASVLQRALAGVGSPIRGLLVNRLTATTFDVGAAGDRLWLDGRLRTLSAAITTAHTSSEALVADALYHVFVTDDAGTLKYAAVRHFDATDVPTYDADRDYYVGASSLPTPSAWRFVDVFRTDGVADIEPSAAREMGDGRRVLHVAEARTVLADVAGNQLNVSLVGFAPDFSVGRQLLFVAGVSVASGTFNKGLALRETNGSGTGAVLGRLVVVCQAVTTRNVLPVPAPYANTFDLTDTWSGASYSVRVSGWEIAR